MVDLLEMYLLVLQEYNKRDNNETNAHKKTDKIRYCIILPSFIKLSVGFKWFMSFSEG